MLTYPAMGTNRGQMGVADIFSKQKTVRDPLMVQVYESRLPATFCYTHQTLDPSSKIPWLKRATQLIRFSNRRALQADQLQR